VIVPVIDEWNRQCQPKLPDDGSVTVTVALVPLETSCVTLPSSAVKLWVAESSFVTVIASVSPELPVSVFGSKAKSLIEIAAVPDPPPPPPALLERRSNRRRSTRSSYRRTPRRRARGPLPRGSSSFAPLPPSRRVPERHGVGR
jgi:hypothetical protein